MTSQFNTISLTAERAAIPRKKIRRSKAEKLRLCHQWQQSGLSKTLFCKQKRLPLSSFAQWCQHYLVAARVTSSDDALTKVRKQQCDAGWHNISVKPRAYIKKVADQASPDDLKAVNISLATGITLSVSMKLADLPALIEVLR